MQAPKPRAVFEPLNGLWIVHGHGINRASKCFDTAVCAWFKRFFDRYANNMRVTRLSNQ